MMGGPFTGRAVPGAPPIVDAPPMYSAEAIEAWVMDEDTGQPLEGVIVVADWELETRWESPPAGQMMVMETVTDAKGRFYFPAWGPKPRWPLEGELVFKDPRILLFKSDYEAKGLQNEVTSHPNTSPVRQSDWNGKTIKLKKFTGSLERYANKVGYIDDSLDFAFRHHDCSWKQIPRILVAIDQEKRRLKEKGIPNDLRSIEYRDKGFNSAHCGSMRDFLRSYLP
jgi:hypothetical protein